MRKKTPNEITRYNPSVAEGLTSAIVAERTKDKLTNIAKQKSSKSYFKIFTDNIFTFFNLIYVVIFSITLVLFLKYKQGNIGDLLFIVIVLANTVIAIWQEIKAKKTVEKLSLVTMPKVTVIRNGIEERINSKFLVLDDIIKLSIGNQIPADCILLSGSVEVNESLLTGETNAIKKTESHKLFAGSYVISGTCYAKVDRVGNKSFIQQVAKQARTFSAPVSRLKKDVNQLVKVIGILIIPFAVLLILSANATCDTVLSVKKSFGAVIGMVPAGMFLLITIALSMGVTKLSKKNTLVQNMYSIEMLARTNVLCLDKTGTITDGTMQVINVIDLAKQQFDIQKIVSNILFSQTSGNVTTNALVAYFSKSNDYETTKTIEFSSKRKHMANSFKNLGTFALGAPEFVNVKMTEEVEKLYFEESNKGNRILMLAHSDEQIDNEKLPESLTPIAFVVIEDHIRDDAIETINWFKNNGVEVKIISGDNPITVANIAKKVGVLGAEKFISLAGLSVKEVEKIADKYTVFGRVTPDQKYALIKALKAAGNVVAMTGDGVNDTLALKEADCSIAMADGSEVARNLSNIVLLDNKFSSLPSVVKEGRQVVNNVQQSSTLYLMKTVLTFLLSFTAIITLSPYPFSSGQVLFLEMFVIGLPSIILALQPNDNQIKGDFVPTVLRKCVPYGFVLYFSVVGCMILNKLEFFSSFNEYTTACILLLNVVGVLNLALICKPYNILKVITLIMSATFIIIGTIIDHYLHTILGSTLYTYKVLLVCLVLLALCVPAYVYIPKLFEKLFVKIKATVSKVPEKIIFVGKLKKKKIKIEELEELNLNNENKEETDANIVVKTIDNK